MKSSRILITGASAGFGACIAQTLLQQGHTVVGTSRRADHLKEINPSIINLAPLDVDSDHSVTALKAQLQEHRFQPDVIILNAGFGVSGSLEESSTETAKAQFETNFFGVHRMIQTFMSDMRAQRGRVIIVGSIAGVIGMPFQGLYSASKFALEGYVDALILEAGMHGVQVSMIQPGDFKTEFGTNRHWPEPDENSPYEPAASRAIHIMANDEINGCDPQILADTVVTMINSKKMKYRYVVGSFSERLITCLYNWLPRRLRAELIRTTYKVPKA